MGYKYLFFDFDGTLADTNEGIVRVFQTTFLDLGFEVPSRERISSTIGLALRDGFLAALGDLTDEQADRAVVHYREIFDSIAVPVIAAFDGIHEVLDELKARGYKMSICTSRGRKSLATLLQKTGLEGYFDYTLGAEDVEKHKPEPDLALKLLELYGASADEALVIGDAHYDLLMAHNAGCHACGVTWGNQNRSQLSACSPEYIVDAPTELLGIL